LKIVEP